MSTSTNLRDDLRIKNWGFGESVSSAHLCGQNQKYEHTAAKYKKMILLITVKNLSQLWVQKSKFLMHIYKATVLD